MHVPVMNIRCMSVLVLYFLMYMPVGMLLNHVIIMLVVMMSIIMGVPVLVFKSFMFMQV
jgi:hypothetical protein